MNPCDAFRRSLEACLVGRPDAGRLTELGWHEHLLGCTACRDLLAQEEALELLLVSLPTPALPPELTSRVVGRLRAVEVHLDGLLDLDHVAVPSGLTARIREGARAALRDERLDQLLAAAGPVDVPAGLGRRVLAGIGQAQRLERLLEDAGHVEVPGGLGQRVLAGLERERLVAVRRASFQLLPRAWAVAAAAALLAGVGAWLWTNPAAPTGSANVDEAVIASLPTLEYWEDLRGFDPVKAEIMMRMDEVDEVLLEEGS